MSVHAVNGIFPAVTKAFAAKRDGAASTVLDLPKVAGPYEIVTKTLWDDGTLSAETTAEVDG